MNDIFTDIMADIIAEMKKGSMPWEYGWDQKTSAIGNARNGSTKALYTGINTLLLRRALTAGCYSHNVWLTYRQAQAVGLQVRKGSRGTACLRMVPIEIDKATASEAVVSEAQAEREKQDNIRLIPKWFSVFNIEQCEGDIASLVPDYSEAARPTSEKIDTLHLIARKLNVEVVQAGHGAYYHPMEDKIHLPNMEWKSEEDYCATLAHELTHATGNRHRLNRLTRIRAIKVGKKTLFTSALSRYAFEELVAEIGAAFLCAHLGVTGKLQRHACYLDSWVNALEGGKHQYLTRAANYAQEAFDFLTAAIAAPEQQNAA